MRVIVAYSIVCSFFLCCWKSEALQSPLPQALPNGIRTDLANWANKTSPLSVQWTEKRKSTLSLSELSERIKTVSESFFAPTDVTYATQDGKFRAFRRAPGLRDKKRKKFDYAELDISFDGTKVYSGNKTAGPGPVLSITPINEYATKQHTAGVFYPQYLAYVGYEMRGTYAALAAEPLARSRVIWLADQDDAVTNVSNTKFNGMDVVGVHIQSQRENVAWFLDPVRNYLPLGWQEYTSDHEISRLAKFDQFETLPKTKMTLPRRVRIFHYTYGTSPQAPTRKPLFETEIVVSQLSDDPIPSERFVVDYLTPGAVIADSSLPEAKDKRDGQVTYFVPADPRDLDDAIDAARKGIPFIPSSRWGHRIWVLVAVMAFGLGVVYFWLRRRGRLASQNQRNT